MKLNLNNKEFDLILDLLMNGIQDSDDRITELRLYPEYWRDEEYEYSKIREMYDLVRKIENVRSGSSPKRP